ncbi:MAG: hypothetical protein N2A40_03935 [Desulfobulbaceae bacterium]
MNTKKILIQLIPLALSLLLISACAKEAPPLLPETAGRLENSLQKRTEGEALIKKGDDLVDKGEDLIEDGEDLIKEGKQYRTQGKKPVDKGDDMEDAAQMFEKAEKLRLKSLDM